MQPILIEIGFRSWASTLHIILQYSQPSTLNSEIHLWYEMSVQLLIT